MSTPNFSYKNRCVLITNDDYEVGNVPEMASRACNSNRYYPSYEVDEDEYPQKTPVAHKIVITPGYYGDACLDFIPNEQFDLRGEFCCCLHRYDNVSEFIEDVQYYFPSISAYRIRKCLGKLGNKDFREYLSDGIYALEEWYENNEQKLCNDIINHIKECYGYKELVCTAVFSNGEAMYDYRKETPKRKRKKIA